jgi:hypothetical protein
MYPRAQGVLMDYVRSAFLQRIKATLLIGSILQHEYQIFSNLELSRSFDEHIAVSWLPDVFDLY